MDELLSRPQRNVDGMWAVDAEQRIVLWNRAAEEYLGYDQREACGHPCHELLNGRLPGWDALCSPNCPVIRRARSGQAVKGFHLRVRDRDGRRVEIRASTIPLPGQNGAGARRPTLLCLFRRITGQPEWPPSLRIQLLGSFRVRRADGSLVNGPSWRRKKVQTIFTLLALRRHRPVSREYLLEALWPGADHEDALHDLDNTIYHLRRALEPDLRNGLESNYIQHEEDWYLLDGNGANWLDTEAFEEGITRARRQPDPARAMELYHEALAHYQGDLLADLQPDFLDTCLERERLRELYLDALEELATLKARNGHEPQAVDLYFKVLVMDPCRESAAACLMQLELQRGERAVALRHYRRLQKALRREFDVEPGQQADLLRELALRDG